MGLPITADVVQSGEYEAFPLYVWFIDHPDGFVWEEMDHAFDRWDETTGKHLAFFVDPFQREGWARSFLSRVMAHGGVDEALRARKEAQRFFRSSAEAGVVDFA